jgi:aerobic-type carbon monoxide dehydrogenase small subunit (CoxS/CutS family)
MTVLCVNGQFVEVAANPSTPLIWILREQLGLIATKYGCDNYLCGACSVIINGQTIRSCSFSLSALKEEDEIMTVEGFSNHNQHIPKQLPVSSANFKVALDAG